MGLTSEEIDNMPIEMCIAYVEEYVEKNNAENSGNAKGNNTERSATQADFDMF